MVTSAVYFNEAPVAHAPIQKLLGMHLNERLRFNYHVNTLNAKGISETGPFMH